MLQVGRIEILGMHCSACSTAVERALSAMDGVQSASVSLSLQMAEVTYDSAAVTEVSIAESPVWMDFSCSGYLVH